MAGLLHEAGFFVELVSFATPATATRDFKPALPVHVNGAQLFPVLAPENAVSETICPEFRPNQLISHTIEFLEMAAVTAFFRFFDLFSGLIETPFDFLTATGDPGEVTGLDDLGDIWTGLHPCRLLRLGRHGHRVKDPRSPLQAALFVNNVFGMFQIMIIPLRRKQIAILIKDIFSLIPRRQRGQMAQLV